MKDSDLKRGLTENLQLNQLQMLLNNVSDAIYIFEKNNTIAFWNKGAEKLYGYKPEEAIGKNLIELLKPESAEHTGKTEYSFLCKTDELPEEFIHYTKDGRRINVESFIIPLKDENETIIGYSSVNKDLTKNRSHDEALRSAHKRLQFHVENSPLAFIEFDNEYRVIQWSKNAERLFGWSAEEILGKMITEVKWVYEEDIKRVAELSAAMLASENRSNVHTNRNYRKDGSVIICEWYNSALMDDNGRLVSVFSLVLDITDRKQAEDALKENEARLLEAQKLAHLGNYTIRYGKEGMTAEWSEEVFYIYDMDPEGGNPTAEKVWSFNHPEDIELIQYTLAESKSRKEIKETEYRIISAKKRVKYIHIIINPVWDETGAITAITGTVMDITETKLIQLELEKTLSNLLDRETKLSEAQKLAQIGSFTADLINGTYEWSDEMFGIFGMDLKTEIPSMEEAFSFIHPDDRDHTISTLQKATENRDERIEMEFRITRKDGSIVHLRYIGKTFFDSSGKAIKRFGTVMDITDRKLSENELRNTLAELKRSNRDLEQFAYIASHDLQEPLRMVSNFARMLENRCKNCLDEKAFEYIWYIIDGAKRMSALITDLLTFSKLTAKQVNFVKADLNLIIPEILRDLQVSIMETNAVIDCDSLPEITADATQIKQLFQNLIQNALKFRGQEAPYIKITAEDQGDKWLFCVRDNGIGINPEYSDKVFVLFQKLHEKEKYPGTGLGLAICKKIVECHGGTIWVQSEESRGAAFFFTIEQNTH